MEKRHKIFAHLANPGSFDSTVQLQPEFNRVPIVGEMIALDIELVRAQLKITESSNWAWFDVVAVDMMDLNNIDQFYFEAELWCVYITPEEHRERTFYRCLPDRHRFPR